MEIETFLSLHCPECNEGKCRDQNFNFFRPVDTVKAGGYFFNAGKTLIGAF